jgi:hypothetical protein
MQYWATKQIDEIVPELLKKVKSFDDHLRDSGLLDELKDSYNSFYGDSKIRDAGTQSELKGIRINHYASLIRNLVSLVTTNKPAWQPIASNTDSASQSAAVLASGLLDFYMKDRRLERTFKNACQMASFMKEAWVSTTWNTQLGEIIHAGDETSSPVHEGDLDYKLFQLTDIIRDYNKSDNNFDWLIVREYKNKWDLIAQFPEHTDKINSVFKEENNTSKIRYNNTKEEELDNIPFYTFYFKPCAALPNGRMITFIEDQGLTDGPLPYPKIPLVRISAEDTFESCFGHSPMMDVLPVQKGVDTLASILLSNNSAFGVQNIVVDKGSGITVNQISGGMNLIEKNPGTNITPLQLTASAPETYKFFDMLIQQSQLLSGINDAVRGQSSAGTSGAALALLSQQAIQFANGLQQSYVALIEDTGTLSINILQRYANNKRVAILTGKHNRPLLKNWSAEDLNGISRITIESGNALSKTASGRLTMADSLLQAGMVKRPEQYISVLQTGNLEPMLESETSQLLNLRRENEKLQEGYQVKALISDDHSLHIKEHLAILDSPDVREDEQLVANVLAHVQDHLNLAKSMPPELSMILGRQSFSPSQPVDAPQNIPQVMDGENSVMTDGGEVKGPNLPVNPATNEQVNPIQQ